MDALLQLPIYIDNCHHDDGHGYKWFNTLHIGTTLVVTSIVICGQTPNPEEAAVAFRVPLEEPPKQ